MNCVDSMAWIVSAIAQFSGTGLLRLVLESLLYVRKYHNLGILKAHTLSGFHPLSLRAPPVALGYLHA